jgi:colanic acid/amylovoran biosynthesis glycosyltransferase
MQITYLINQYPKVSHSFIRREILALEKQGFNVQRIAQRGWKDTLVDSQDLTEREKTKYIVKQGAALLFISIFKVFLRSPVTFLKTLCLAFSMKRGSDRSLVHHMIYFVEACQMQSWLKAHQSNHIHAHFGTNSAEIAMFASQLSAIPFSFTVHGPEEFDKPQALGLNQKIKLAKFVAAISSFGRSQLFRWADFKDWKKIKEVHCGLEKNFYENVKTSTPQKNSMVCVGRICEQKGQLLLIEAVKKLHDNGVLIHLVLAGDGEMREEVESLINQYHLQAFVTITGWISSDEVRHHLLASEIMVLPSFAEGLPVVIMEAMSLKRPVISTYVAGIPELIKHKENGWLCAAGDVDALTDVMQEALTTSKVKLKKMADLAYENVVARHNIDTEAAKLAQHIKA